MALKIFISDLHLDAKYPQITARFLNFLKKTAVYADELYILGDLFDYWIGDDNTSNFIQQISSALEELNSKGVKIFFIHGNRDFLIGSKFADKSQIKLLPELTIINLGNHKTALMHGDSLCTLDKKYQNFRKKVRNPLVKFLYLKLPIYFREKIAAKARKKSQETTKYNSLEIMDVNPNEVNNLLQQYNLQIIIHGHTHKPNIHKIYNKNSNKLRIVLGDWKEETGSMLICDAANCCLVTFNEAPNLSQLAGNVKGISTLAGACSVVELTATSPSLEDATSLDAF